MFDIGWSELAVIAVVALVVIGPKDLPKALRVVGIWVRKARNISREFQGHIDQMIREAELEELREQVKKASTVDINKEFEKTIDPTGSLAESLKTPPLPDLNEAFAPPPTSAASASATPAAAPEPASATESLPPPSAPPAEAPSPDKAPAERAGTNP
jgi:sec-independent protein translocase protein TatB